MKSNKSLKTLALWAIFIVVLVGIFQSFAPGGNGRTLEFSQFISEALPSAGPLDPSRLDLGPVRVYGDGAAALVEYDLRAGAEADSTAGMNKRVPHYTYGDVRMPLGPNGQSLYASLQERGVQVDFHPAAVGPDGTRTVGKAAPSGAYQPFSAFVGRVQALKPPTNVARLTIRGKEITGVLKNDQRFNTVGSLAEYRQALVGRGIEITEENDAEGSFWLTLLSWLPMLLIFFFFFAFMRQIQSGGGKAMSFGKSKARLLNESTNKVTFKDVAGIDEAKEELQEIVAFLKEPKKFQRLGGRIPKGVLLMGPPGTGKTLLAKGVAGEAGVPFFSISGSDFVEMFVGVGASRVRDLFEQGKKNAPCIIFIDEIDAVGRHRGAGLGGGHDEREQTLNQLLVEMDGFESNDGVILVAATNRPDVLDPALLRPGRFDRRVVVNRPDVKGRLDILKVHTRHIRPSRDLDLEVIARGTPGFAGADLENLVNEAALLAARADKDFVEMADFEAAKDKVMMGSERRSAVMTEEEKRLTAFHEAGHAIVARKVPGNDPVHKVTIIPRGMALGVTWTLPKQDNHAYTDEQVLGRIAMAMGGRVAEELVFGRVTTGAGNDIEQATKLARRMVCEWGMSRLGPIALAKNEGSVFLGREIGRSSDFSDQTQAEADAEIKRIIDEQHTLARSVVAEHRAVLDHLAEALLVLETLTGEELERVFEGATIEEIRKLRADNAAANVRAAESASSRSGLSRPSDPPFMPEPASARRREPEER